MQMRAPPPEREDRPEPADLARALWADALTAADLLALAPALLGGARLRARPGPARDAWLARLKSGLPPGAPLRRIPAHATEERLLGGLDLAATLAAGRPVARSGLLAEADGGVAVLAMAERAAPNVAAHLGQALDRGEISVERDGTGGRARARIAVVALDEGIAEEEEAAPAALCERLAFDLSLDLLRPAKGDGDGPDLEAARARLPAISAAPDLVAALCRAADALGVESPRAAIFALRTARAAAALAGRAEIDAEDAALAVRLTLAPRATRIPAAPEDEAEPPEQPPDQPPPPEDAPSDPERDDAPDPGTLAEMLVEAARARLPAGLLAAAAAREMRRAQAPAGGTAGAMRKAPTRGRPIGARPGRPEGGARLDLIETLRAAAPWQPLRRRENGEAQAGVLVRREDFRIRRFKKPAETATIFAVDASGSSAAQRLAEAKGAVELLLAESYVRRDRVALIAFRGAGAETILPPTRALARAKRALAGLPGGGGTPLAAGLDLALAEALQAQRRGWTPTLALLTDGRANVARDGAGGRAQAAADALASAAAIRAAGIAAIVIDSAPRPGPQAAEIATAMGARYVPLPRADAARLSGAVKGAG
ncbi:MAG: magnesium chelatase subunit D [Rubrimonas sp.]|uniref:magnesium chelatase subunit D n=1 Tax=Rubrimonas sp. TaxID=2036015 RepID=UPI002FDC904B